MLITLRGLGLSYRSQKMPKCGKNKKVAHKVKQIAMLIFLPDFLVFFFVIIITIQTYSNLEFICFICYKKLNAIDTCMCLSSNGSLVRTNQNVYIN